MGFLDLFRARAPEPADAPDDPLELRDALFDAVGARDQGTFRRLVDARAELIAQSFPQWTAVADDERADPARVEWLFQGVAAVAEHFAEQRGDDRLLQQIQGDGKDPISRWQDALQQVDEHLGAGELDAAQALLDEQLVAVRQLQGGSAATMLALTLSAQARRFYAEGLVERALEPLAEALDIAREAEDLQGEHTYLGNLAELFQYLGDWEQAGDCFGEQAELLLEAGADEQADRAAARAERVRAGEPLNRVIAVVDGEPFELAEVPLQGEVAVAFVFHRSRPTLPAALRAVARGLEATGGGQHEDALVAFDEAAAADPLAPQPPYQRGITLLQLGRAAEAGAAFAQAEALAPGWFRVRAHRWIAAEVASGRLPAAAFEALRSLQSEAPAEEKLAQVQAALAEVGRCAHLELELGKQHAALGHADEATRVWRAALEPEPEPDVRSRLLTALSTTAEPGERRELLQAVVAIEGGNLIAQASAAVTLRLEG